MEKLFLDLDEPKTPMIGTFSIIYTEESTDVIMAF